MGVDPGEDGGDISPPKFEEGGMACIIIPPNIFGEVKKNIKQ